MAGVLSVVLPLLRPALGTLALITFIASWNNFMAPLVVMRAVENYTLPLALRAMQSPNNTEWGALMLGSAGAAAPARRLPLQRPQAGRRHGCRRGQG
jgi:multiple sugar transport system permease protein